jgi:ribonuclease P protein component
MQLKRSQTMKRASEFAMVRSEGKSEAGRFLILSTATLPEGDDKPSRFGIITTRRLGHAVVRNLLRRRIREILRAHGEPLANGHYVVLIPRHSAATAAYAELEKDFLRLLKRKHFTSN